MKKYCSECMLPLAYPAAVTCDKCGKPTRPIDIFERVTSDDHLTSKDKKLFGFVGVMNIAASVIALIWTLIMIAAVSDGITGLVYKLDAGLVEPENILRFRALILFWRSVVILSVILAVEQLVTLFFSVMILLKKAWAVHVCRVLYLVNTVLYFLLANLISFVISLCTTIKLSNFISKMDGGSEYNRRAEDVAKAAYIASDKTVWQCKSCGYVNPVSASECKSCGKWKG